MCRLALPVVAIGAVLTLSVTDAAWAATVSVSSEPEPTAGVFEFRAVGGEENRLSIAAQFGSTPTWVVRDDGAALSPGTGCSAVSAHEVRCSSEPGHDQTRIDIELGDGDDVATLTGTVGGTGSSVRLGDGADRVSTKWTVPIDGGSGDDVLTARGRAFPTLLGGDGSDTLRAGTQSLTMDGGLGNDLIDGGPRRSAVTYASRCAPVRVDLAATVGGQRGERDTLRHIRWVQGGAGDDVLRGTRLGEVFDGGAGADVVRSRGGRDSITAERGDRVWAGSGNDRVDEGRRPRGTVHCGSGRDFVAFSRGRQREGPLLSGCEDLEGPDCVCPEEDPDRLAFTYFARPDPVRLTPQGELTFRVGCPVRCFGLVRITRPGAPFKMLARARFRRSQGAGGPAGGVEIRLPTDVAVGARGHSIVLRISIRGNMGPVAWRFHLRLPH